MRAFIRRWVGRTRHIPPRDFWPTLLHFVHYAFVQAGHAARRSQGNADVLSHLNFKRAHYLEKAMLCEYERSPDLDASYRELKRYLDSDQGKEDGCYLYLNKLAEEYAGYPGDFACFMHKVQHKPRSAQDVRTLRRIIVQRRSYLASAVSDTACIIWIGISVGGADDFDHRNPGQVRVVTIGARLDPEVSVDSSHGFRVR